MKRLLIFAFPLLAMAACGPTLKVTHDVNSQANFTNYKTFAVYNPGTRGNARASVSELNRNRVDQGIIAAMTAKGYTQADTSTADLLVNPITVAKQGQSVTANTDYYGYGGFYRPYGYWGGGMGMASSNTTYNVDKYIDGSLIIDVVDRSDRKLLWQGVGNSQIDGPIKDPDTKIPEAVSKIMESFPKKM
ncbi:DUF4136 domain-containing protein [Chitinophaga sp. sic0106]|uniref:DUF4136 domain-containing protein n=1 Tax=Chitinophaga sp. sic0106 TaxID=2854785 RepID=UPI001C476015|nr:DUF4136 domain-containing protein [Chitinophaga sp. sic0106]MBV7529735.1 DUF4136 domain-containing protein [Chitinophaga sp. sic0106]